MKLFLLETLLYSCEWKAASPIFNRLKKVTKPMESIGCVCCISLGQFMITTDHSKRGSRGCSQNTFLTSDSHLFKPS